MSKGDEEANRQVGGGDPPPRQIRGNIDGLLCIPKGGGGRIIGGHCTATGLRLCGTVPPSDWGACRMNRGALLRLGGWGLGLCGDTMRELNFKKGTAVEPNAAVDLTFGGMAGGPFLPPVFLIRRQRRANTWSPLPVFNTTSGKKGESTRIVWRKWSSESSLPS